MEKIGVGIITCNRPDFFRRCFNSIPVEGIDDIVVINDGDRLPFDLSRGALIENEVNQGVGKSKNKALEYLLSRGCDYIFIMEDDAIIKNSNIFSEYIKASKITGIQHFNFGPGSPFNRRQSIPHFDLYNRHLLESMSEPNPKLVLEYPQGVRVCLYEHVAGVFSFFTKEILKHVGLHDEQFVNAWEHVDHTYRIILASGHPPFWWFADIANSVNYIETQEGAITKSTMSGPTETWMRNVNTGRLLYQQKHGYYPNTTPSSTEEVVVASLKSIKKRWTT